MLTRTCLSLLLALPLLAGGESQWVLEKSTVTYHVSHPLHDTDGVSHAARGKGACRAGECEFLIAVPVKSFESGDTNRDLHMLQVTRGGQFPMVTVRTRALEEQQPRDDEHRVWRAARGTLDRLPVDPPTLFAVPVKNEMPVRVEMTWREDR